MKTVAILLVRCLILKVWYPNGAHSGVEKSVLSYNESNTFAKMADACLTCMPTRTPLRRLPTRTRSTHGYGFRIMLCDALLENRIMTIPDMLTCCGRREIPLKGRLQKKITPSKFLTTKSTKN